MQGSLSSVGSATRRTVLLVLHDASQPWIVENTPWKPKRGVSNGRARYRTNPEEVPRGTAAVARHRGGDPHTTGITRAVLRLA